MMGVKNPLDASSTDMRDGIGVFLTKSSILPDIHRSASGLAGALAYNYTHSRLISVNMSFVLFIFIWSCLVCSQALVIANISDTCITANWTVNSLGQTPCQVEKILNNACSANSDNIQCLCNSVVFSLSAACEACHGNDSNVSFPKWRKKRHCDMEKNGTGLSLSQSVSKVTVIPAWAFLDLHDSGTWNLTAAQALTGDLAPSSTTASNQTALSPRTETSTASSSNSSMNGNPGGHTRSMMIVGGILGGVIAFTLLVVLCISFWRWRKHQLARNAASLFVEIPPINYPPMAEKYPDTPHSSRVSLISRISSLRRFSRIPVTSRYEVTQEEMQNFPLPIRK